MLTASVFAWVKSITTVHMHIYTQTCVHMRTYHESCHLYVFSFDTLSGVSWLALLEPGSSVQACGGWVEEIKRGMKKKRSNNILQSQVQICWLWLCLEAVCHGPRYEPCRAPGGNPSANMAINVQHSHCFSHRPC